ncbi:MAG: DUF1552 domain-containing protein [Acidobacteria bacterium]|nr:DUF1552 domain-containing protein [Acidobacteriota bacterium]
MIIRKIALPRRTFLRGAGAALALPLLDAMVPALTAAARTAANPVRRLGFVYFPHGSVTWSKEQNLWTPAREGKIEELPPILSSLGPYRDQVTVVTNLEMKNAQGNGRDGNGEHTRANATFLSAARPKMTVRSDVRLATTVDQIAARELCKDTRLPSLELALDSNFLVGNCDDGYNCVYVNTIAWSSPTTPLPAETNPRRVFERLFGEGGSEAEMQAEARADRSILDAITEDLAQLRATLGPEDRGRMSEYLDTVREVERRIRLAERQTDQPGLTLPEQPVGVPDSYDEHAKLMLDLQVLAYQADITRVFTMMVGREQNARPFPWIGVNDGHHAISHHQDNPEKITALSKINAYQVELFAYLLQKLHATPDGPGSLLDHSMLLYGSGISNGNLHDHKNLPILVAGGGAGRLKGGRHIKYAEQTPMANLLVGLLDRAGVHVDRFGDSTGRIDLEPLSL